MFELTAEVRSAKIDTKEGIGKTSGKPYRMDEQEAFVTMPNGETRRVTLSHQDNKNPLSVGKYRPKPSAFWVGDFGALSISTRAFHWEPVAATSAKA